MSVRRLNLDEARAKRDPNVLTVDGAEYPLPAVFDLDLVLEMRAREKAVQEALTHDEVLQAFVDARELLMQIVRERTPAASTLKLEPEEILDIFAFIVGYDSVEEAIKDAIAPEANEGGEGAGEGTGSEQSGDGDGGDPLASTKPSSPRSSRSGKGTAGRRATGTGSPGATSGSTSPSPA